MFGKIIDVPLQDYDFFHTQQYCKCTKEGVENTVTCNYNYDYENCEAEFLRTKGTEDSQKIMYSKFCEIIENRFLRFFTL